MWRTEVDLLGHRRGRWSRTARAELSVSGREVRQLTVRTVPQPVAGGPVIVPGFHDSHLHLRAAAAARLSVDLSTSRSVPEVLAALGERVRNCDGRWIRGWGWDEAGLEERRAPTIAEVDAVTGSVPCALHHRTGKVVLVNSAGWRILAGPQSQASTVKTPVPADEPLLGGVPRQPEDSLESAVAAVSSDLAAAGVTSVTDASATNTLDDIDLLGSWARRGVVRQRVNAFVAFDQVPAVSGAGLGPEAGRGVRVLGAKIAASADEISDQVRLVREHGWPVAVHATEPDEVEAALNAISRNGPPAWGRDRIEHLGLPLPGHLERIAAARIAVVTNPTFVTERATKYRESLSAVEQEWLYPVRSVLAHGIPLAAGSDRPVTSATPLAIMAAAVHRAPCVPGAKPLGAGERVTSDEALSLVTDRADVDGVAQGARARAVPVGCGSWADADFIVVSADPRLLRTDTEVLATVVGGRMVWGPADAAHGREHAVGVR